MQKYILRRLLLFVPSLVAASLIMFIIMRVLPGDVALAILGAEASESGAGINLTEVEEMREQLGLKDPLPVQYVKWAWSMVNGEFGGASVLTGEPLSEILARRLPPTMHLAIYTIIIATLIGLPLGVVASLYQDRWPDYALRLSAIAGHSMPHFWIALMLVLFLVVQFSWAIPLGYKNAWEDPVHNLLIVIWPALILAWRFSAYLVRVTRSNLLDVYAQDYIRTARSKGLSERVVVVRHALRNGLIPVVTLGGLEIGTLLGGTVILENIFGIPGLGQGMVGAAQVRDFPVVQSLAMLLIFITLTINLITDLTYSIIDPRVKYD